MKAILALILISSFLLASSFIKKINIVIDTKQNIMWQDNKESISHKVDYTMAKIYCEDLILNAYIDWRLPSVKELTHIIAINKKKTSIEDEFKYTKNSRYLSNTKFFDTKNNIWYVDFSKGIIDFSNKKNPNYIRCVRDIK